MHLAQPEICQKHGQQMQSMRTDVDHDASDADSVENTRPVSLKVNGQNNLVEISLSCLVQYCGTVD